MFGKSHNYRFTRAYITLDLLQQVDTDATDGDSVIPDDEPLDDSNLNDVADEETDEQAKMIKNRRMSSRSSSRSRVF